MKYLLLTVALSLMSLHLTNGRLRRRVHTSDSDANKEKRGAHKGHQWYLTGDAASKEKHATHKGHQWFDSSDAASKEIYLTYPSRLRNSQKKNRVFPSREEKLGVYESSEKGYGEEPSSEEMSGVYPSREKKNGDYSSSEVKYVGFHSSSAEKDDGEQESEEDLPKWKIRILTEFYKLIAGFVKLIVEA